MNTQKGMSTGMLIGGVAILILIGGAWMYLGSSSSEEGDAMMKDDSMMMEDKDGAMMEKDDSMKMEAGIEASMEAKDGDAMMEKDDSMMMQDDTSAMEGGSTSSIVFTGSVLAGTHSPLLEFNESDYAKALASDKLVVLYFYASLCPTCRAEFPVMEDAFDTITNDTVVGFRVHFNDDQTTPAMENLAREYGVPYQHTKVFVKNNQRVLKSPETWTKERYISEITNALK